MEIGARAKAERMVHGGGDETDVTLVHAWWKGFGGDHRKSGGARAQRHVYTTRLCPTSPLELGMAVRVVALARGEEEVTEGRPNQCSSYDPHVVGTVTSIEGRSPGWAAITIRNECHGNDVGEVVVELPHVVGKTVRRRWLEGEDTGETEQGIERGGSVVQRRGARSCGAATCWLEPRPALPGQTIRVRPLVGDEKRNEDLRPRNEGVFAIHLWMKYDYAK